MNEVMEYKVAPTEFKAEGDKGEYEGYFSVIGNLDDGGDVIEQGAFIKTISERRNRIKVFFGHDWSKLIAPPPEILKEDEHGLFAKGVLTLGSFWGREAWELMKDGALTEGSIGYSPVKFVYDDEQVRHLKEIKLYEISPVPLGMNPLTSIQAVKDARSIWEMKGAIPPHSTAKADEGVEWDSAGSLRDVEGAKQLRMIHAWVDPDGDPDVKGSYKLPHHLADGRVVWKGVSSAGAALMGARGGVRIPQDDVAGVKRHLARHYDQFDKTPPWEDEAGLIDYYLTLEAVRDTMLVRKDPAPDLLVVTKGIEEVMSDLERIMKAGEPSEMTLATLKIRLRSVGIQLRNF